jgi:hypothetical protein
MFDLQQLHELMDQRMEELEKLLYRDYMGGTKLLEAYRETKYWKELIERETQGQGLPLNRGDHADRKQP